MPSNREGKRKPKGRLNHEVSGHKGRKTETGRQTERGRNLGYVKQFMTCPRKGKKALDTPFFWVPCTCHRSGFFQEPRHPRHEISEDRSLCPKISGWCGLTMKLMELHSQAPSPQEVQRGVLAVGSRGHTYCRLNICVPHPPHQSHMLKSEAQGDSISR